MKKKSNGIYKNLTSYADPEFSQYMRRTFLASAGYDKEDLSRPIVGIADTSSDYNPCHRDMPSLIEAVKRGILEAGGLPMVFHTASLHEILMSPTTMLYRNLLAIETEEMIRAHPMDSVVLLGGCDKTLPAQLMAMASIDIPSIILPVGPMRSGMWKNERLGACTDCRRYWAKYRAGQIDFDEISQIEKELCPTAGTCMVMGTASTMACMCEALGMSLPGSASPPSGSGERLRFGVASGRKAIELYMQDIRPSHIMTQEAFYNAVVLLMALGGSTNAVIHLSAIARRRGFSWSLKELLDFGDKIPVIANCKPSGNFYMEDFHHEGGVPMMMKKLLSKLKSQHKGVSGKTISQITETIPDFSGKVIYDIEKPCKYGPALIALYGNLAPQGAIMKRSAMNTTKTYFEGRAIIFESPDDVAERIDDPCLGILPDDILILRNVGPVAMGMPEAGSLPIPKYLASQGITDMVRISDGRMSGTSYGSVVLHVSPESAIGGPLAFVQNGDKIVLDLQQGTLSLQINEKEFQERRKKWIPPSLPQRGWAKLYAETVLQADKGCDLNFL